VRGRVQVRAGFLVAPLPVQPLAVAKLDPGPFERHLIPVGDAERGQVVLLRRQAGRQQCPGERARLQQPGRQLAVEGGEDALDQRTGLVLAAGPPSRLGEVDEPDQGLALVRRASVVGDQPAQPVVGFLGPVGRQRGHPHRMHGPRSRGRQHDLRRTVQTYISRILTKLDAKSRVEIVREAVRQGVAL
jgi:hypothetical protein